MSLAAAALQIATVRALQAANVQAQVFSSAADPRTLTDKPQPVVIVAAISGRMRPDGRAMFDGANHCVELVLDCALAKATTQTYTEGQSTVSVTFPDADDAHDLALNTLAYECKRALFASRSAWSEIWKRLWDAFSEAESTDWTRGATANEGTRLAILRNRWQLEAVNDPTPGQTVPDGNVWFDLLALMDADASLQKLSGLWRSLIETPAGADWQVTQGALGLSLEDVYGSGFGPASAEIDPAQAADDPAPLTTEAAGIDRGEFGTDANPTTVDVVDGGAATVTEDGGAAVTLAEEDDD